MSGGESRKLTVALNLIGLPSVLVLQDPTSGLDTGSAQVRDET